MHSRHLAVCLLLLCPMALAACNSAPPVQTLTVDQVATPVMSLSQAEMLRCPVRPRLKLTDADKADAKHLANTEGVALLRLSDLYDRCASRADAAIVDLTVPGAVDPHVTPATP
jgi:hypothetical protein